MLTKEANITWHALHGLGGHGGIGSLGGHPQQQLRFIILSPTSNTLILRIPKFANKLVYFL